MEAIYHATGDPLSWTRSDNWLRDAPLSARYGVKVDAGGRVKALELGNNSLTGAIPPEIGNLAALGWLSLNGNDLSGPIPPELADLTALTRLHRAGSNRGEGHHEPFFRRDATRHIATSWNMGWGDAPSAHHAIDSPRSDMKLSGRRPPPDGGSA